MLGQPAQQVFLWPLLPGTDGRKMSQSLGNYIGVTDPPGEMYGKIMRVDDQTMIDYYTLLTDVPLAEVETMQRQMTNGSLNPMDAKMRLAREIVSELHSREAAARADEEFVRVFRQRRAPDEIEEREVRFAEYTGTERSEVDLRKLIADLGLAPSRSEARRLLQQGAVEIEGTTVKTDYAVFTSGSVLRVGKRRFVRIIDANSTGGANG
jgi:tyrosyl-tRNA synthetase